MTNSNNPSGRGELEPVAPSALAPVFGADVLTHIPLVADAVDRECFKLMDLAAAKRLRVVPVESDGVTITVAVADPSNIVTLDDLRLRFARWDLNLVTADEDAIDAVLARWSREIAQAAEFKAVQSIATEFEQEIVTDDEDGPMAELVNRMLEQALAQGASDIHVEPTDDALVVRFRVDGALLAHNSYPLHITNGVINRIKVMGQMDVSDRRTPQDGRFNRTVAGREMDCRVVTLPTAAGKEGAVMRLFDQSRARLSLDEVGFHPVIVEPLQSVLAVPHGMVLVTGPTGSGKTTTLYAALQRIARPDRKVLTIEDPVEIRFPGITQVQVNEKAKLSFSGALRSFLRADPDVILVGEIRDRETAALAAQAALTGHVVLSTLHTNEAAGAATRLSNLGLEGFVVASALRAVLAQRLIRRLCVACALPYKPTDDEFAAANWPDHIERPARLFRAAPNGCPACSRVGYKGRAVVAELMLVTDDIAAAIVDRAPSAEIERLAKQAGTVPLHDDAIQWVADGVTSLDEITRAGV